MSVWLVAVVDCNVEGAMMWQKSPHEEVDLFSFSTESDMLITLPSLPSSPPPILGGVPINMFPDQESRRRGPPSKNLYQVLRGRSSSSRFMIT